MNHRVVGLGHVYSDELRPRILSSQQLMYEEDGGGRRTVENFGHLVTTVLDKSVWGVEFFMVTDRDAGPIDPLSGKVAQLPRYHLENYFLDSEVLAACFETIEDDGSWLRDHAAIEKVLSDLAVEKVGYAVALKVSHAFRQLCGNVTIMPSGAHDLNKDGLVEAIAQKAEAERIRNASALELTAIREATAKTYDEFLASITDGSGSWKIDVPGKPILKTFCHRANIPVGRLKNLYLKIVEERGTDTFDDLVAIFEKFSAVAPVPTPAAQQDTGRLDGLEPVD